MDEVHFYQDPQLATEKFSLRDTYLQISGGIGENKNRIIQLTHISPRYEHGERRFKKSYLVPLFLFGLFIAVAWGLLEHGLDVAGWIVLFLSISILFQMRFSRVELARFSDIKGNVLFVIYRPNKNSYKYDEFISEIVRRINVIKNKTDVCS